MLGVGVQELLLIGDILAHGKTVKCEPIDKSGSNKFDKLHKNPKCKCTRSWSTSR